MKKIVLIVAGGSGKRMNNDTPKQFIEIGGLPVVMHTFFAFTKFDNLFEFVLVLPQQLIEKWQQLCLKHKFDIKHMVAEGGPTRFHSVKNGLATIDGDGIVFIHDAVRPFVSADTIQRCLSGASNFGNALPVVTVTDSVRILDNNENYAADRSKIFLVQTPQTFRIDLIKNAYQCAAHEEFTDDATVLENTGAKINLVEGNRENIKITTTADLLIAGAFLKKK